MPTDLEVHEYYQIIGKHKHADRDYFYLVWRPERATAEAAENEVKRSSQVRAEHANLRLHEKAARIFNEDLAKTGSLLPHAQ